jgi:transposase
LYQKGQKTVIELSSVVAANAALEIDVTNRISTLASQINYFTEILQQLQQQLINNQIKLMKFHYLQFINKVLFKYKLKNYSLRNKIWNFTLIML